MICTQFLYNFRLENYEQDYFKLTENSETSKQLAGDFWGYCEVTNKLQETSGDVGRLQTTLFVTNG